MIMTRQFLFPKNNSLVYDIATLLQKCSKAKSTRAGKQVHAWLVTTGTNLNLFSLNSRLVAMYAGCSDLKSASIVFHGIQNPNVFALNWMISASAFNGGYNEAIGYFCLKRDSLYSCNKFTFSFVLKACIGLLDLNKGKQVHSVVKQLGFEKDVFVANALIDMYCKCGCVCHGRKVFDKMLDRDVASWTSMICGYCSIGEVEKALVLFERMKLEGFEPNDFTWSAMISCYARSGNSDGAFAFMSTMKRKGLVPDLVTWNAMISGFVQGQRGEEALRLFSDMLISGIKPNLVTVTGLLPACGMIGSLQRGRETHGLINRMGLDINVFVASALIDMYSKCGSMKDARAVFEKIHDKNVASWNAMIGCYAKHGMVESSMQLFERMQEEGIQANEVTLVSIISACSHSGSIDQGLKIFSCMKERFHFEPSKEHYACVVDMLCRSGRMVEAYELVKKMPTGVIESIAGAFFNGCMIHGRRDMAEMMVEDIMGWDLKRHEGFRTLSNIYAAGGEWNKAENVWKVIKRKKGKKRPGSSWVEKRDELVQVSL